MRGARGCGHDWPQDAAEPTHKDVKRQSCKGVGVRRRQIDRTDDHRSLVLNRLFQSCRWRARHCWRRWQRCRSACRAALMTPGAAAPSGKVRARRCERRYDGRRSPVRRVRRSSEMIAVTDSTGIGMRSRSWARTGIPARSTAAGQTSCSATATSSGTTCARLACRTTPHRGPCADRPHVEQRQRAARRRLLTETSSRRQTTPCWLAFRIAATALPRGRPLRQLRHRCNVDRRDGGARSRLQVKAAEPRRTEYGRACARRPRPE